jgi:hypothetical protein
MVSVIQITDTSNINHTRFGDRWLAEAAFLGLQSCFSLMIRREVLSHIKAKVLL